ncbi:MAG TPA: glycoside hydrolase family 31 protein [Bryobacteraceae bacterium]|nr:glycoside hydrolase family 31 protein [Bryobacteraceae bacterium]
MRTLATSLLVLFGLATAARAIDVTNFVPIGPAENHVRDRNSVTVTCRDHSQIRFYILAPDLIRVRASFGKDLPQRDHSWAIAKTSWDAPRWTMREEPDGLLISTAELEVFAKNAPLLVEFRDAATHRRINADLRPMMYDPRTGAVAAAKELGFDEHFYGLGEKAARLDKRRDQFTMWNSDTPAYKEGTDPIYQDVPFYLGWQPRGVYGIFFDNSYRSHFDFGGESPEYAAFSADGGEMNYYFFWGPSMKKVVSRYADLTGHLPLPPKWALGNQQSRWSYYPDTVAEEVVSRYRAEDLPLDVLHLDINYMNGYRVFTWDPHGFPDPSAFTAKLRKQGVKVVVIVDPGVKYEPGGNYTVYNEGAAKDYFLKRTDGKTWIGAVWPGKAVYADFTMEGPARWWGDLHRKYLDDGVAGIWNDMNEPSDFLDQTGKTQMDVVFGDGGANTPYAANRNLFALTEAKATYEGLVRLRPNQRPYVITRAGYAGIQRYSTMWTGDNTSTWEAMALSIPMFETLGLSGEPFVGADAGGFIGRADAELLTRWYEIAFLTPFCRNHAQRDAYDHEPWRFGTYYEGIIRKYLKLRYQLLPFLYTALEDAHRTGVPMFRPLILNYQDDANVLNIDDEFMIGGDLLAAPILKPGQSSRRVYLPAGTWIDYWTGRRIAGGQMVHAEAPLETVPLFVHAGAIISTGPDMNYVGEKPTDPITFHIYPDAQGKAQTSLYEDDGVSPAYREGRFRRTHIRYENGVVSVSAPEGDYQPGTRTLVFTIAGGKSARFADDGRAHQLPLP